MKPLTIVCSVVVLSFLSDVDLRIDDGRARVGTMVTMSSPVFMDDVDDPYGDPDARKIRALSSHTVKMSEDVLVKDITGTLRSIEDALSGSGTVIDYDPEMDKSLILTAEHVCDRYFDPGDVVGYGLMIVSSTQFVIRTDGKKLDGYRIVSFSKEHDICLVEVNGIAGSPASFAAFQPDVGSKVFTAGAPAGAWDTGSANVVEGYFSGILAKTIFVDGIPFDGFAQYSMPIVGGMSGSSVYYNGRIVGILTAGTGRYEHLSWGPSLIQVRDFVERSMSKWGE